MMKILKELKLKSANYIFFLLLSLFAFIGECGYALINKTVSSQENPSVTIQDPAILNSSLARKFEFVPHSNAEKIKEEQGKQTAQAVPPQPPAPPEQPPIPPKPIPPDQTNIQQSQPPQPPIPPVVSPNATQQTQKSQLSQRPSLPAGVPPVPAYPKRIQQDSSTPPPPPVATFPSPSLPAANSQQGFIPTFTNMLAQLAKVVVLLLALGGAIFAYKKFKQDRTSVSTPKIEKSASEKKPKSTKAQKPQKEHKKPFLLSSLVALLPFKKGRQDKTSKNENNTPQITKTEPETVSQAVSSFVRHKIRR